MLTPESMPVVSWMPYVDFAAPKKDVVERRGSVHCSDMPWETGEPFTTNRKAVKYI